MSIAVASSPASGSIEHAVTACTLSVSGASSNTLTGYDPDNYPASPEVVYYLSAEATGEDSLVSPRFAVSSAGTYDWYDVIFPAAGTWTLHLRLDSDDSSVANTSLTVS